MAKAVLEAGEQGLLVTGLDVDDAAGREARLGDGGREQVLTGDAPQDLALGPRRDPGGEQGRGCPVHRTVPAASHFVQGADRQPAAGEPFVDRREPERKGLAVTRRDALEAADALAQVGKRWVGWLLHHDGTTGTRSQTRLTGRICSCFVR